MVAARDTPQRLGPPSAGLGAGPLSGTTERAERDANATVSNAPNRIRSTLNRQ